jgi:hypothetical protein
MITPAQRDYTEEHAYLPEHVIPYVTAVSGAEPFLLDDFIVYFGSRRLIFVGYPLKGTFEEKKMKKTLDQATKRFKPDEVALTAPSLPPPFVGGRVQPKDDYYRLDLSAIPLSQKLRNMVKRANRDLSIKTTTALTSEHAQLVDEFLDAHPVDGAFRIIFQKLPSYLSSTSTAILFEARNREGDLVAFDIFDFGPRHYGLYMFNFSSRTRYVPGVSDLLLFEAVKHSLSQRKTYINLGLGINPGVTFFKKKWGGVPFLPYMFYLYSRSKRPALKALFQKIEGP